MASKSIAERKKALEEQLDKLKDEEQREEKIRQELIGYVVAKAMESDVELGSTINELLDTTLTKKAEREKFGLAPLSTKRGRPKGGVSSGG